MCSWGLVSCEVVVWVMLGFGKLFCENNVLMRFEKTGSK